MRRNGSDATSYRDVLAVPEFRFLYAARLLSLLGDQVAKIALAVLVYRHSHSALLAAATFAVTFLPWLIAGPFLSVYADRYHRRDVMIACDVARAAMVGALAIPGLPLAVLFVLLVLVVTLAAPFEAARAALLPEVLEGDHYVVGSSLLQATTQGGQVAGYLLGGAAVALLSPTGALVFDAATFALSALLVLRVRRGVRPAVPPVPPKLLTEARSGASVVFTRPVLRWMVLIAWVTSVFLVVPEGLAVACAAQLDGGGVALGFMLAAVPAGALVGALGIGRVSPPHRRVALIRPLALLSCLPLLVTGLRPGVAIVALTWMVAGLGNALHVPAIATFVSHTPAELRGRAFGLAEAGLQAVQGLALLAAGGLALVLSPTTVVAVSGALGFLTIGALWSRWPKEVRALADGVPVPEPEVLVVGHPDVLPAAATVVEPTH